MADVKITALTALTAADPANDVIPIVDVSDTTMAASGTTKKISVNNILGASGTATLASATITGALDAARLNVTGATIPANGVYLGSANNLSFSANSTLGMTLNSTGLLVGGATAQIIAAENTTLTTIGNMGAAYASATGTYFAVKVGAPGGIVELKADARSGAYPPMVFTVNAAEGLRLNTNAALVLKGGTTTANGVGVAFPATQVASSDANCLDDYEEGTWTGTLTGSTTNPTVAVTATGRYTKIGRQVSVQIAFESVSTIGASGNLSITGLPFTNAALRAIGTAGTFTGATFTGTLISQIESSTSAILFYGVVSNAAWASATHNPNATTFFWANLTYTV